MAATTNSMKVEASKPMKEPDAAFKAVFESALFKTSPM